MKKILVPSIFLCVLYVSGCSHTDQAPAIPKPPDIQKLIPTGKKMKEACQELEIMQDLNGELWLIGHADSVGLIRMNSVRKENIEDLQIWVSPDKNTFSEYYKGKKGLDDFTKKYPSPCKNLSA